MLYYLANGYLAAFSESIGDMGAYNMQGARITVIANAVLPSALIPLFALALLSVVLSSADTTLLSSSIIINGWCRKPSLLQARMVILFNGLLALMLALVFTDIIGTLLLALAVYAGAFTVPILWGLLGLKAKPKFVGVAIIAGGILALSGKLCPAFPGSLGQHTGDILMIAAFVVNAVILALGRCPRESKSPKA